MNSRVSFRRQAWATAVCAAIALLLMLVAAPGLAHAGPPPDGWAITFTASESGFAERGRLTLGAAPSAADGADDYDEPLPPRFPIFYLDLYTEHSRTEPGWGTQPAALLQYRAEYRSPLGSVERRIPFVMATDRSGPIALSWSGIGAAQLEPYHLLLRDDSTGENIDLREQPTYAAPGPGTRSFELILRPGRGAATLPIVTAAPNQTATEGAAAVFDLGAFTDAGPDGPWTVDVDWGDGSAHASLFMTAAGAVPAQAHSYADNGAYTVAVQVTDGTGASGTASFQVSAANLPPSATLSAPAAVDEGDLITLSLNGAADPSSADAAAGFTYAFDCGSGYGSFGSDSNATCPAAASGSVVVKAAIRDKDGGTTEYSATVAVNPAPTPPVLSAAADQTATEGAAAAFDLGAFTDTGVDGPWTVDVDWGDGSAHTAFSAPAAGPLGTQSHTYTAAGRYTVMVTVSDNSGTSGSASFTITVEPPGACSPLTWHSPPDGATPYDLPVSSTFTIRFSWGDCHRFIHDESVIIQVENPGDPTTPITSWVYGREIIIDDAAREYRVDFTPGRYGLTAGTTLPITVYMSGQFVGQASVRLTP